MLNSQENLNNIDKCHHCNQGDKSCGVCGGHKIYLTSLDKGYYWERKLSQASIYAERQIAKWRMLRNAMFFTFGFVGFLSLVRVIFIPEGDVLLSFEVFWQKNEYVKIFWFSLLVDSYLIYRITRDSDKSNVIKKNEFQNKIREGKWSLGKNKKEKRKWENVDKYFDVSVAKVVDEAWLLAKRLHHPTFEPIHIMANLFEDDSVKIVIGRLGIKRKDLLDKTKRGLARIVGSGEIPQVSEELRVVILRAYASAVKNGKARVATTDLLYALTMEDKLIADIMYDFAITQREIDHVIAWVDLQQKMRDEQNKFSYKSRLKPKTGMNRAYTAVATPILDSISRDMTIMARSHGYPPIVGRESEIKEIFRVLESGGQGVVLVGEPGIGKRAVVQAIAQLMVAEEVPKVFQDKRLVSLSIGGLVAGASEQGVLEARIMRLLREIVVSKNIILFISDIHHLIGISSSDGNMDAAETLAEQLYNHKIPLIATTTPDDYKRYIERSGLSNILQKNIIKEPTKDETIRILESKAIFAEYEKQVFFSFQSLEAIVDWTERFFYNENLPRKAIKALDEVALYTRQKKGEKSLVTREDVAEVISELTNVPIKKMEVGETQKLLNLEEKMHEKVIGQDMAIKSVASALRRARTQLRGENKPIASFLFLGSTGVGKTQVAKTLAQVYFGDKKSMVRLDMSEYQADDAIAKIIGDAQSDTPGILTEAIGTKPFSLLLLDELEKAHPDILNVFLQVLDEGRLTDAFGKTVDFTHTIIIATSNAGTRYIQEAIAKGEELEKIRENLINNDLKNSYRPEFLNRFDGIVVFHPLEIGHVAEIAKLFLGDLAERLDKKGVQLSYTEKALVGLAKLGYDPAFGARPLRRVIQDKVEDGLARMILENRVGRRDEVVIGDDLSLGVKKAEVL